MGNTGQIKANEVQVMSAGTGIFHSEYNADAKIPLKLFQIWVFPSVKNLRPRYEQKAFDLAERKDKWQRLVSPDEPGALLLNQKTWFSRTVLSAGQSIGYTLNDISHGVYIFVIEGSVEADGILLETRDGMGISEASEICIRHQRTRISW